MNLIPGSSVGYLAANFATIGAPVGSDVEWVIGDEALNSYELELYGAMGSNPVDLDVSEVLDRVNDVWDLLLLFVRQFKR